jgi:hypothetical protein
MKYSEKIRNARLNVVTDTIGPAAILRIYSGPVPSSCDAANPSGLLVEIELPHRPFNLADGAKLMISEPWSGWAHADGIAKSFRLSDYMGAPHVQGTISKTGGGGDMELDIIDIHAGQKVVIGAMTLVEFGDVDDEEARSEMRRVKRALEEA